jgi:hypothetical protein
MAVELLACQCGAPLDLIGPKGASCRNGHVAPHGEPGGYPTDAVPTLTPPVAHQPRSNGRVRPPSHSIPASYPPTEGAGKKGIALDAARWEAKPLSTLTSEAVGRADIWAAYIARGYVTLFTGLWKIGKSTLLARLLKAAEADGEFGGQAIIASRVLLITEESSRLWAERRDSLDIGDHVHVIARPFLARPDLPAWERFIGHVAAQTRQHQYDLIIFDSLPNLWPVRDENAAAEALAALMPLNALTELGPAVLLVAHPKKGDAGEGQATRGSGAVMGFVDVILEMRRYDAERREDCRRVLTSYSRFDDTPTELVLDYDPEQGYTATGSRADAREADRQDVLRDLLPETGTGKTVDEVRDEWPKDASVPKPGRRTLARDLSAAARRGDLREAGQGVKGDPYRYTLVVSDSIPASPPPRGVAGKQGIGAVIELAPCATPGCAHRVLPGRERCTGCQERWEREGGA